ncbi:hypothetical protein PIB30_109565, partial [Stylosanthes scabra]|nr:hypothetical protein [Stylosanthes scabra]
NFGYIQELQVIRNDKGCIENEDMMEILQRMEINQQNLSQQIQSLQKEQRKIWRSVRRVEAWTFNEDFDEDLDEDQD